MAEYLTTREVAAKLRFSTRTIRKMCERGQLRAMQGVGLGNWRIPADEVEAYEQRNTRSAEAVQPAPTRAQLEHAVTVLNNGPLGPGANQREVSAPVKLDGFTLPADYVPVFPAAWGMTPEEAASRAAGRGRSTGKKKASSVSR